MIELTCSLTWAFQMADNLRYVKFVVVWVGMGWFCAPLAKLVGTTQLDSDPIYTFSCRRHSPSPCEMPETVWVRAADFFALDEDSTIEINGGHPPILLNEGMLDDLVTESLPLASDASVAEGLLDLVHDELVGYGTDGSNQLDDRQMALSIRSLEAVIWRLLGMPLNLPFRNFTTFRSYWMQAGASGHGGWQARRDIIEGSYSA